MSDKHYEGITHEDGTHSHAPFNGQLRYVVKGLKSNRPIYDHSSRYTVCGVEAPIYGGRIIGYYTDQVNVLQQYINGAWVDVPMIGEGGHTLAAGGRVGGVE